MVWSSGVVPVPADGVVTFVPADGGDVMVFHDGLREMHRLAGAAGVLWAAVDGTRTVSEVVELVAAVCDVDAAGVSAELLAGLEQMHRCSLIRAG